MYVHCRISETVELKFDFVESIFNERVAFNRHLMIVNICHNIHVHG